MPTTAANVLAKSVTGTTGAAARRPAAGGSGRPAQTATAPNVGDQERLLSLVGGGLLAAYGLTCRGLAGVVLPLVGGSLVLRGATGTCAAYKALGIDTRDGRGRDHQTAVEAGAGHKVEEAVTVDKPAAELFQFWRQFDRLPRFMGHLKAVTMLGDNKSHWVAKGPLGTTVEWDAEVNYERFPEVIAWRSLPGADVDTAGSVHFNPAPGGRGTEVRVVLKYDPPAGKVGAAVARLFGEAPDQQVRDDLGRFKQLMEGGHSS